MKTLKDSVLRELTIEEMQNTVGGIRIVIGGFCIYDSSRPKGHRWFFQ